jgi:1,2-diacylglycerol 3-alpha-glucosyltransferase
MHIAFFTNFYLPVVNGVVRSVATFRQELSRLGHNVFIFAQQDNDYEDDEPFIYRYPALSLPLGATVPAAIPVSAFIDRLLPSLKLDVIHSHHPVLLGQTAVNKAVELDLPLVFTFHTQYQEYTHYFPLPQEIVQDFLKNLVHNWLVDYMRKCQHIVIPSESMRKILEQDYGLRARYTVVPTGINVDRYSKAEVEGLRKQMGWQDDQVVISIGRLAAEKNWPTFLRAAAQAYHNHPALRVVLIGDGPERAALDDLVDELGIAERVTFTGQMPFEEIPAYLKVADLFAFASTSETQGLVTMEALAAGLPVVAVDASGTRDVLEDGGQGFLVEDDPLAMAAAIEKVLGSRERQEHFRSAALERAKSFDIQHLAEKMFEVYQQAIEDKRANRFVEVEELSDKDNEI